MQSSVGAIQRTDREFHLACTGKHTTIDRLFISQSSAEGETMGNNQYAKPQSDATVPASEPPQDKYRPECVSAFSSPRERADKFSPFWIKATMQSSFLIPFHFIVLL